MHRVGDGMKEIKIEDYIRVGVEKRGGLCEKFVSPGRRDVPDRDVSLPYGIANKIEVKRPGEKPRRGQLRDHARRRALGHDVWVISTKGEADWYFHHMDVKIAEAKARCKS